MSVKYLQSAADGGLVVDIDNSGGVKSGSRLQVLDKKKESNQWWTMVPAPGGYFWIQSSEGDLVIDIDNTGGVKSGSQLQVLKAKNETNQYWKIADVPHKPGYFRIKSAIGDLVVDIDNSGGVKSGSRLQALDKKKESNQYWTWVNVDGPKLFNESWRLDSPPDEVGTLTLSGSGFTRDGKVSIVYDYGSGQYRQIVQANSSGEFTAGQSSLDCGDIPGQPGVGVNVTATDISNGLYATGKYATPCNT